MGLEVHDLLARQLEAELLGVLLGRGDGGQAVGHVGVAQGQPGRAALLPVVPEVLERRPDLGGIVRRDEEVVGGLGRVGEVGRVGGGDGGDLVLGHELGQGLGVLGAPALQEQDVVLGDELLVGGEGLLGVVGVVHQGELELGRAQEPGLVDVLGAVAQAVGVGGSDVGGGAGEVGEHADADLLGQGRDGQQDEHGRA